MKRPVLFLSVIFVSIICSTALVSTAISTLCRSFNKNDTEKNIDGKSNPAGKQINAGVKHATVKF